jgi:hypothetical protein
LRIYPNTRHRRNYKGCCFSKSETIKNWVISCRNWRGTHHLPSKIGESYRRGSKNRRHWRNSLRTSIRYLKTYITPSVLRRRDKRVKGMPIARN